MERHLRLHGFDNFSERIAKVPFARINKSIVEQVEKGRKILDEIGEEEYDRKARERYKPVLLKSELLERKPGLRFRGE